MELDVRVVEEDDTLLTYLSGCHYLENSISVIFLLQWTPISIAECMCKIRPFSYPAGRLTFWEKIHQL